MCPAAAPHGETVHVHIGAGSLVCRPAGPPPTRHRKGKEVNNHQRQPEAKLRRGYRKGLLPFAKPVEWRDVHKKEKMTS